MVGIIVDQRPVLAVVVHRGVGKDRILPRSFIRDASNVVCSVPTPLVYPSCSSFRVGTVSGADFLIGIRLGEKNGRFAFFGHARQEFLCLPD